MHLQRWLTGIVAFPLLVLLIYKGGAWLFAILVAAVSLLTMWEYFRAVSKLEKRNVSNPATWVGLSAAVPIVFAGYNGAWEMSLAVVSVSVPVLGLIGVMRFARDPHVGRQIAWTLLGIFYIPLFLSFLAWIRNAPNGGHWVFLILCTIFAGDVGAYYAGSYRGRRKLIPAVSPKKTVEGALGGLASNVAIGLVFKLLLIPRIPWIDGIVFFLALGAAGQVGDLFESVIKRSAEIKDSGGLLPGHGGFWDRIDALLFAAPVAFCFKIFIFG